MRTCVCVCVVVRVYACVCVCAYARMYVCVRVTVQTAAITADRYRHISYLLEHGTRAIRATVARANIVIFIAQFRTEPRPISDETS